MPPQTNPEIQAQLIEAQRQGRILPRRRTVDGWDILVVHWSAVPGYDYESIAAPLSQAMVEQELELNWNASSGKVVYPDFGYGHHVATQPLQYNPHSPLFCGWDFGGNIHAFVPVQINAHGQLLVFPSLHSDEETAISLYEFGQIVANHLQRFYAEPNNLTLKQLRMVHYGDPAGQGPPPRVGDSPKELRTCFQILDKGVRIPVGSEEDGSVRYINRPGWGWKLKPGPVNFKERVEGVTARLKLNMRGGHPAIVVDPRATLLIEGFSGSYHFHQRKDGRYDFMPEKNLASHVHDALQYVTCKLFSHQPGVDDEEDEDVRPPRQEFRSHAAGRNNY